MEPPRLGTPIVGQPGEGFSIRTWFERLSSGVKMLLILSMALLPLGMMALFASQESAARTRIQHVNEAKVAASASARQFEDMFGRLTITLRDVAGEIAANPDQANCVRSVEDATRNKAANVSLAVFQPNGRLLCRTEGFQDPARMSLSPQTFIATVEPSYQAVRFAVADIRTRYTVIVHLPIAFLTQVGRPDGLKHDYALKLVQGAQKLELATPSEPFSETPLRMEVPLLSGQLQTIMLVPATRVSASEVLLVLLPILMWLAAAIIGWIVVDRLLLRPLADLQRAISNFRIEDGPLILPRLTTPAHEIRDLSESFQKVTSELLGHDAEMASGLARQRRLTREVHHRVKNNLQVVSSLISLHARGAPSEDAVEAYAAIQRRVDALAVVHRNHYAELEENHGLSLRALIAELAANLRGSAPEGKSITVTLSLAPLGTNQDVAVPVSFIITEIMELIMLCSDRATVAIILEPIDTPGRLEGHGRARLSIASTALLTDSCQSGPHATRFHRVMGGLARQLRAPMAFDEALGTYCIEIDTLTPQISP